LGISFVEAPTKFTAPSLTLPVAIDVGRVVFAMSHRVQIALALAAGLLGWRARRSLSPKQRGLLIALLLVLPLQLIAIQLPLDARAARVIAGESLPPSSLHAAYVVVDLAKISLLASLGWSLLRSGPRTENDCD